MKEIVDVIASPINRKALHHEINRVGLQHVTTIQQLQEQIPYITMLLIREFSKYDISQVIKFLDELHTFSKENPGVTFFSGVALPLLVSLFKDYIYELILHMGIHMENVNISHTFLRDGKLEIISEYVPFEVIFSKQMLRIIKKSAKKTRAPEVILKFSEKTGERIYATIEGRLSERYQKGARSIVRAERGIDDPRELVCGVLVDTFSVGVDSLGRYTSPNNEQKTTTKEIKLLFCSKNNLEKILGWVKDEHEARSKKQRTEIHFDDFFFSLATDAKNFQSEIDKLIFFLLGLDNKNKQLRDIVGAGKNISKISHRQRFILLIQFAYYVYKGGPYFERDIPVE